MSTKQSSSAFLSLPNEIHRHILSFLIPSDIKQVEFSVRKACALSIIKFQALNSKLCKETNKYLMEEFWWKLFQVDLGTNASLEEELNKLKEEMIRKNVLRRKLLLMRFIKSAVKSSKSVWEKDIIKMVIMGEGL